MKYPASSALAALVCLAGVMTSPVAMADRGHWHADIGIGIGVPLGYPYGFAPYDYGPYYRYPPYYYPPVVVAPAPPPVYIERGDDDAPASPGADSNYWYYCAASQAYYPYAKTCPEGWLTVVPNANAPHP
jgi:hypothetical protein